VGIISGGGSGGGGGSGLPPQWTDGGNGNVTATVDDPSKTALKIDGLAAQSARLFQVHSQDGSGLDIDGDGAGGVAAIDLFDTVGNDLALLGSGVISINADTEVRITGSLIDFRAAVAAPSDGSLISSSFALWLDATPGATKLMVKAKDSGGTVRTATIPLS
jgi:hypothetical protein